MSQIDCRGFSVADQPPPGSGFTYLAAPPPGYTVALGPRNTLIAVHALQPVLYFDETEFAWRELMTHVSKVAR